MKCQGKIREKSGNFEMDDNVYNVDLCIVSIFREQPKWF